MVLSFKLYGVSIANNNFQRKINFRQY